MKKEIFVTWLMMSMLTNLALFGYIFKDRTVVPLLKQNDCIYNFISGIDLRVTKVGKFSYLFLSEKGLVYRSDIQATDNDLLRNKNHEPSYLLRIDCYNLNEWTINFI